MKRFNLKKITSYFSSDTGLSLIEILASITILFILTLSLLPLFVQSTRSNTASKDIMDSTYLAESNMETIEDLINPPKTLLKTPTTIDKLALSLSNIGFTQTFNDCSKGVCFEMNGSVPYVFVQFINSGSANEMVNVKVKIFKDKTKAQQQAQMETLLFWSK